MSSIFYLALRVCGARSGIFRMLLLPLLQGKQELMKKTWSKWQIISADYNLRVCWKQVQIVSATPSALTGNPLKKAFFSNLHSADDYLCKYMFITTDIFLLPPHLAESDFHVFRNVDLPIVVEVRTKGANADLLHINNAIEILSLLNLQNILRITLNHFQKATY